MLIENNELIKSLKSINYQRNGVSGTGFYTVQLVSTDDENLIVTFSLDDKSNEETVVLDKLNARAINYYSIFNCYRGDCIAYELEAIINDNSKLKAYFNDGTQAVDLTEGCLTNA